MFFHAQQFTVTGHYKQFEHKSYSAIMKMCFSMLKVGCCRPLPFQGHPDRELRDNCDALN